MFKIKQNKFSTPYFPLCKIQGRGWGLGFGCVTFLFVLILPCSVLPGLGLLQSLLSTCNFTPASSPFKSKTLLSLGLDISFLDRTVLCSHLMLAFYYWFSCSYTHDSPEHRYIRKSKCFKALK